MAVNADGLADPRYLRAVIDIAMRGLPHSFRKVPADPGQTVVIEISGPSGGQWTLSHERQRWILWSGVAPSPTTHVRLNDQEAWKLLFNALSGRDAERAIHIEGHMDLGRAVLHARSVIV